MGWNIEGISMTKPDMRVTVIQAAFECPDISCRLAAYNCLKCIYEKCREDFNDLSTEGFSVEDNEDYEKLDWEETAQDIAEGGYDYKMLSHFECFAKEE